MQESETLEPGYKELESHRPCMVKPAQGGDWPKLLREWVPDDWLIYGLKMNF
jgi:hypothetical protein